MWLKYSSCRQVDGLPFLDDDKRDEHDDDEQTDADDVDDDDSHVTVNAK